MNTCIWFGWGLYFLVQHSVPTKETLFNSFKTVSSKDPAVDDEAERKMSEAQGS